MNHSITSSYKTKIVTTPIKTRIYVYEKPIFTDFIVDREDYTKAAEGIKRQDSIYRSRDNVMDTINANVTPYSKFITLTTKDTVLDRDEFIKMFKVFQKYFQRKFGYRMPYVAIMERQKKRGLKEGNAGSWHIHIAVFIQEKLNIYDLIKCWIYGHLDIVVLKDEGDIGRYMMKYLSKDNYDIALNKKMLLKSQNLKTPSVVQLSESLTIDSYDYITTWDFYQGDITKDLDQKLFNSCIMYEIHHKKGGVSINESTQN